MRIHKSVARRTGIHQTSVRVPPGDSRDPVAGQDRSAGIRKIAKDYERSLVAILRQKGVELQPFLNREGRQIGLVAWTLDTVPWTPNQAEKARHAREPIAQDASAALTQVKFLLMSLEDGDIMQAALDAYELGRLVERVSVHRLEPGAARGRKTPAAVKAGHGRASGSASRKTAGHKQ